MSEPTDQERADLQDVRGRISFGLDVQAFMNGPIGRHLTARANAVIAQAQEALGTVNPYQPQEIMLLQNKITAASYFLEWMGEAVTDGEQAETSFINAEAQQG